MEFVDLSRRLLQSTRAALKSQKRNYAKRGFKHFSLRCALNEHMVRVFSANHVERFRVSREIKVYVPDQIRVTTFVGSCHGLICIALTGNDVVLWNPSTRKSKILPDFDVYGYSFYRSYGFGYDESGDDYKVVGFYFGLKNTSDVLVKIYSRKTGKLKRIKNHKGGWMIERPPTFANGKIHWFVRSDLGITGDLSRLNVIGTEEYGMLEKPDSIEFGWGSCMTPVPGGSFCISCKSFDITKFWLVEPYYGVGKTNWIKVFCSPDYDHPYVGNKYPTPPTVLENGDIVLISDGKIMILNPKYLSESLVSPY